MGTNNPRAALLLIDIYAKLISDKEAEVRNISCVKLFAVCSIIGGDNDNIDVVLKQVNLLVEETVGFVKSTIAEHLLSICSIVGKAKTTDYITSLFLALIKDPDHTIRITLLKTIDKLNEVVGVDSYISNIISYIKDLAESKSWRVKIEVIEVIPYLAKEMVKR